MFILLFFCFFVFIFCYLSVRYRNPYTLTFLFGKKGAGKSCWMVAMMLKYLRRGWNVYTDMSDINISGVRIIKVSDLSSFRPEPRSAIFLDEVGISMDNRDFKSFPKGLRDFFKFLRKMQCVCIMNSQAFDVDKKVRDTTDSMALVVSLLGCISLYRPIVRSICLVDASGQSDSRIADNLRFTSFFSWRFLWMPLYYKYFNSYEMPSRSFLPYVQPAPGAIVPVFGLSKLKEVAHELSRSAQSYFANCFRRH